MDADVAGTAASPPRVATLQIALALACAVVAALGYLTRGYLELAWLVAVLTGLSAVLLVSAVWEAVRTGVAGKALLLASTMAFFWLEALGLAFQEPPFLVPDGVPISSAQFAPELVQEALWYVALFQLMLLVGYSVRPPTAWLTRFARSRVDSRSAPNRLAFLAIVACTWLPVLASYGFRPDTTVAALIASRSSTEPTEPTGFINYLAYFGIFGAALLVANWLAFGRWSRPLPALIAVLAALPFALNGARHLLLYVAVPACVLVLARNRQLRHLSPKRAASWGVLALLLLLGVQLEYTLRSEGWSAIGNITPRDVLRTDTTGQFTALLFAEYIVPATHPYFAEPAETYFIINWIPRTFWPDKPVMASWSYYNDAYTEGRNFNVTPSVIGEFHINWGVAGVAFIGLWLGFLTLLADRLMLAIDADEQHTCAVVIGMFYAFVVASFRFYYALYFTYFAFGFIGMLLLTKHIPLRSVGGMHAPRTARSPGVPRVQPTAEA